MLAAYVPWSQKRLRLTKQVVALDLKMSDELFQAALAHVWDASREVKAVRQINSDRGLKRLRKAKREPDVLIAITRTEGRPRRPGILSVRELPL